MVSFMIYVFYHNLKKLNRPVIRAFQGYHLCLSYGRSLQKRPYNGMRREICQVEEMSLSRTLCQHTRQKGKTSMMNSMKNKHVQNSIYNIILFISIKTKMKCLCILYDCNKDHSRTCKYYQGLNIFGQINAQLNEKLCSWCKINQCNIYPEFNVDINFFHFSYEGRFILWWDIHSYLEYRTSNT
jgi:hypothetical protein